jgi:hypothetical protein
MFRHGAQGCRFAIFHRVLLLGRERLFPGNPRFISSASTASPIAFGTNDRWAMDWYRLE